MASTQHNQHTLPPGAQAGFFSQGINIGHGSAYVQGHGNTITINQGPKQLSKYMGVPPYQPVKVFGRAKLLATLHGQLNLPGSAPVLLNGRGGMGKTTLAALYYHSYQGQYCHLLSVFAEGGIRPALLSLTA